MYKSRNIKFKELLRLRDWNIKSYTISENDLYTSHKTYESAIEHLSIWLDEFNSFNERHDNIAFLILHEGTEGVFALINTWVGSNMLQTHIFLSKYDDPKSFTKISGDGLFACVWELEIINHERCSWILHILKKSNAPDYQSYLKDVLNVTI